MVLKIDKIVMITIKIMKNYYHHHKININIIVIMIVHIITIEL